MCQITCKSLQKSSKCQNFLRVWHLVVFRADQLKKTPCKSSSSSFVFDLAQFFLLPVERSFYSIILSKRCFHLALACVGTSLVVIFRRSPSHCFSDFLLDFCFLYFLYFCQSFTSEKRDRGRHRHLGLSSCQLPKTSL